MYTYDRTHVIHYIHHIMYHMHSALQTASRNCSRWNRFHSSFFVLTFGLNLYKQLFFLSSQSVWPSPCGVRNSGSNLWITRRYFLGGGDLQWEVSLALQTGRQHPPAASSGRRTITHFAVLFLALLTKLSVSILKDRLWSSAVLVLVQCSMSACCRISGRLPPIAAHPEWPAPYPE